MNEQGILYRYLPAELEPPSEVWDRLVKVLDDAKPNSFEKMNTLEILPPSSVWDNIASALDEHDIPKKDLSFADIFSAAEITPPPFVWNKIENALDAKQTQTVIRGIGSGPKTIKRIAIGLAIAASIASIVFLTAEKFDSQPVKQNNTQVAIKNNISQQVDVPFAKDSNTETKKSTVATLKNAEDLITVTTSTTDDKEVEERELMLEKYKPTTVPIINTTNGKFANTTGKIKDAFGKVIYRIGDYNTSSGYLAAIGPNGNSVMVSTKLANMIEFFQEDSTTIKNEEYLDKVMRESNVWRQKLIDWRKKVDAADTIPSQMNFLDLFDLIRFFKENK